MNQLNIGRGPDFLLKHGQVEIMHSVSVQITDLKGTCAAINIVDRSHFAVCQKLNGMLHAKSSSQPWTIQDMGEELEEIKIESNRNKVLVKFKFPHQMGSESRRRLKLEFLKNIRDLLK
ncbi:MAG: hypothetical protein NT027_16305 [Proteobacteria bacterium]|nr:hypothetical protein [Pseudomonadota bacterium]